MAREHGSLSSNESFSIHEPSSKQVHAMEIEQSGSSEPELRGPISKSWILKRVTLSCVSAISAVIAIAVVIVVVLKNHEAANSAGANLASDSDYILAGHLGAVDASMILYSISSKTSFDGLARQTPAIERTYYHSLDFKYYVDIVKKFLKDNRIPVSSIACACFVVEATVVDGHAFITIDEDRNAGESTRVYDIDAKWMTDHLKFKVVLVNDFLSFGYGVLGLGSDNTALLTLQEGEKAIGQTKVVMGLGSGGGLGIAHMNADSEGHYTSYSSEGGLRLFTPQDDLESDLLTHIRKAKFGASHISVEAALNMSILYDFFAKRHPEKVSQVAHEEIMSMGADAGSVISRYAVDGQEVCDMVIQKVFSIFGATAGDVALDFLPKGGLYIGAGTLGGTFGIIKQHFTRFLEGDDCFMCQFEKKGKRMSSIVKKIPVYLVLRPRSTTLALDLAGALFVARRVYLKEETGD